MKKIQAIAVLGQDLKIKTYRFNNFVEVHGFVRIRSGSAESNCVSLLLKVEFRCEWLGKKKLVPLQI